MPFRTNCREPQQKGEEGGMWEEATRVSTFPSLVLWASIGIHLRLAVAMLESALPPTTIRSNLANSLLLVLLPALRLIQQPQRVLIQR